MKLYKIKESLHQYFTPEVKCLHATIDSWLNNHKIYRAALQEVKADEMHPLAKMEQELKEHFEKNDRYRCDLGEVWEELFPSKIKQADQLKTAKLELEQDIQELYDKFVEAFGDCDITVTTSNDGRVRGSIHQSKLNTMTMEQPPRKIKVQIQI